MAYTDVWDVTSPLDTQAANQGAADFRATKLDIMQRVASFGAGVLANRPTPEATGATADWTGVMYWATDTKQAFMWNGAAWVDISSSIPSGGSGAFSDNTQGNVTNPSGVAALNTVTVPGSFTTSGVFRITVAGTLGSTAGSPGLKLTIAGVDVFNENFGAVSSNQFLYDVVLQAITSTEFWARGTFLGLTGGVTTPKLLQNGFFTYVTGTPFNVVLNVSNAFTGNVITDGMAATLN